MLLLSSCPVHHLLMKGMMQPRVVHINSVSNLVENITFMHCPPERRVTVAVPVRVHFSALINNSKAQTVVSSAAEAIAFLLKPVSAQVCYCVCV